MGGRKWRRANRGTAPNGLFVWLCIALCACARAPAPTRIVGSTGEVRKVASVELPAAESARPALVAGDFVLSGGGVEVVVGGLGRPRRDSGVILWGGVEGAPVLARFEQTLWIGGRERRIQIHRLHLVERGGIAALRMEGAAVLGQDAVQVEREWSLARAGGALSMVTRLSSLSRSLDGAVRLGARIHWGGALPFVPGAAPLEGAARYRGSLVGAQADDGAVVFGQLEGDVAVRLSPEPARAVLGLTEVQSQREDALRAGTSLRSKSALAFAPLGLSWATRLLGHVRGRPFPEIWVSIPYRPEGVEGRLLDRAGNLWMLGRPDDSGRLVLPVVSGSLDSRAFRVQAYAFGHHPGDAVAVDPSGREVAVLSIPRGGRIRVKLRDAASGAALPGRVRIVGIEGTAALELGPDHAASGAGDTLISLDGQSSIAVPPGRYRVIVSHGPEWTLHDQEVRVTKLFSPRVDAGLERAIDPGLYVASDLHLHASPSPDSEVTLEDRLSSLVAEGIELAVATDHNHVTDYEPARQRLSLSDLRTLSGVEVTTVSPAIGHFNVYPVTPRSAEPGQGAPDVTGLGPAAMLQRLRTLAPGAVIQVNHPRSEGGIGYFDVMRYDPSTGQGDPQISFDFDALEVWNGFELGRLDHFEQAFEDWLSLLSLGYRVAATGSSDSHKVRGQLAGYPRTYAIGGVDARLDTETLARSIREGRSFITSGPFLELWADDVAPGGVVHAGQERVKLRVSVRAAPWVPVDRVELLVGRDVVQRWSLPRVDPRKPRPRPLRFVREVELPFDDDTFVIARASAVDTLDHFFGRWGIASLAFTNPVFVDGDGDGTTPWDRPPDASTFDENGASEVFAPPSGSDP